VADVDVASYKFVAKAKHAKRVNIMKIAGLAAVITFLLRQQYGCSWLFAVPIFFAVFLGWHGYRMFIYDRFLNPLSRLPGPKVVHPG
jgi:hypothetical protein